MILPEHSIQLLPEGAVILTESSALVVADLHLGKSAAFRARGLPIPEGDTARDLSRLLELCRRHSVRELIVAGDLFHSSSGITPEVDVEIRGFLDDLAMPFTLVGGNHDAKIRRLPADLSSVASIERGGIRIIHDPADATDASLHIGGHWHPVVRIRDGRNTSLRMPCFLLRGGMLVLPSFGSFTGGAIIQQQADDRFFVPLRDRVIEVPMELLRKK
jgi:DNA ligase-associated metallophosphoesterase